MKTCAQPLCLYNVSCVCAARVPRMFVMSTRVGYCICCLCIHVSQLSVFVCVFVCVCEPERGRFSPHCQLVFWHVERTVLKVCILYVGVMRASSCQISHLHITLFLYLVVSFTHTKYTPICSQQPLRTHAPPQLSTLQFLTYLNTSTSTLITREPVGRKTSINFCNVTLSSLLHR